MAFETKKRKTEHIDIALNKNIQAREATTGFENVHLIHKALPESDKPKIDLSTIFLGHKFKAPIIAGAITGGTQKATKINMIIAEAVEELGLGMGVGSQRAAIEDSKLETTFAVVRERAPTAFLVANVGGAQLVDGYGLKEFERIIKMIEADAVAIHLNALQEAIQPEGQTNFFGLLNRIGRIARELDKPIIVKETGAGISAEEAVKLKKAGVRAIDVSGVGGTSWAAVEYYRANNLVFSHHNSGTIFWDWGIPTAVSIVEVSQTVDIPVIASGGIRNGVEIVKSLALGASIASLSYPILKSAVKGFKETRKTLQLLIDELQNAMFLLGTNTVTALKETPIVITGRTAEWLNLRGFNVEEYAQRGRN